MASLKHFTIIAVISLILISGISFGDEINDKDWVVLHENISQGAERLTIPLTYNNNSSYYFRSSQTNINSEIIEKPQKDKYTHRFDLGKLIDGNRYVLMIKEPEEMKLLTDNSNKMLAAKLVKVIDKDKTETVEEGIMFQHNSFEINLQVPPEKLFLPRKKPLNAQLSLSVRNQNQNTYVCRKTVTVKGAVTGTASTDKAAVKVSLASNNPNAVKSTIVNLTIEPFDGQMRTLQARDQITNIIKLGSARAVVEKIAADCSELVLAMLSGNVEQVKIVKENETKIGKPFPDFANVDMIQRKLITLSDLKNEAGNDGYIVLLFGDFKINVSGNCGFNPNEGRFSLDETIMTNIIRGQTEKNVVIGYICKQLSLTDLYEKWLGTEPGFHVISDFSNPLDMQIMSANSEPYMYRNRNRNEEGESLSKNLNFGQNIVIVLLDSTGKIVYMNEKADKELSLCLTQINGLIKEGAEAKPQKANTE